MKHSQAVSRLECVAKVRKIDWSATENYKRAQEVKRLECAEKDGKVHSQEVKRLEWEWPMALHMAHT